MDPTGLQAPPGQLVSLTSLLNVGASSHISMGVVRGVFGIIPSLGESAISQLPQPEAMYVDLPGRAYERGTFSRLEPVH